MAFIVEDGTGIADATSYTTVAYADSYFLDRNNAEWAAFTTAIKESLLIQATDYIETVYYQSWVGVPLTTTQSLAFPRSYLGETLYPDRLQKAVCELALKANTETLLPDVERQVNEEKVDVIEVKYSEYASQLTQYSVVTGLLSPYFSSHSSSSVPVARV